MTLLSRKFQYAVHALKYMAENADERPVSIHEISDQKTIPRKFLECIMLQLRNAGIIGSKRGHEGGYYLIRRPEEISMADVLAVTDNILVLLPCLDENGLENKCAGCTCDEYCQVKETFHGIQEEFRTLFGRYNLYDLTSLAHEVRESLHTKNTYSRQIDPLQNSKQE